MQTNHNYVRLARAVTALANSQDYDKAKLYRMLKFYSAGHKAMAKLPRYNAATIMALAKLLTSNYRAAWVVHRQLWVLRQCITGAEFCVTMAMAGAAVKVGRGKLL